MTDELIKELRDAHFCDPTGHCGECAYVWPCVSDRAASLLESLSARVTQAETKLAQAKHDAWWAGAEDERLNGSPVNPHPAPTGNEATNG